MINQILWLLVFACCSLLSSAVSGQGEPRIIPGEWQFQEEIQSPSQFAGHPYGSRHWPHALVVDYMRYLGEHSDRAVWQPYARSHGGRELGFLTITSAANHK